MAVSIGIFETDDHYSENNPHSRPRNYDAELPLATLMSMDQPDISAHMQDLGYGKNIRGSAGLQMEGSGNRKLEVWVPLLAGLNHSLEVQVAMGDDLAPMLYR
jgi:hypothetical protein